MKDTFYAISKIISSHYGIPLMNIFMYIYLLCIYIGGIKILIGKQIYIYIYIYNKYILLLLFWWSPFIPSMNLDEVFTYNHIWL